VQFAPKRLAQLRPKQKPKCYYKVAQLRPKCLAQLEPKWVAQLRPFYLNGAPYTIRSRKTDVYIRRPSVEMDTIVYELPSTLHPENLPEPVSIKTQFGEYQAKVEITNNQLSYIRRFQLNKGRYPASDYVSFVDFFDKVSNADNMRCVMIKK
ncbi:MAG: hypothetical protein Q8N05_11080, partial [Bacteroidota bacterium]|nr:hypothetical protein [Bacteroidota bacterium]